MHFHQLNESCYGNGTHADIGWELHSAKTQASLTGLTGVNGVASEIRGNKEGPGPSQRKKLVRAREARETRELNN